MEETTKPLLIQISWLELEALRRFKASQSEPLSDAQAVRLLVREQLVMMGDLALTDANRGRAAGSKRLW
jgi:hypothetical protein